MTCKDCVHYGVCVFRSFIAEYQGGELAHRNNVCCQAFKNKSDVVEVKWISVKDKLPEKHDAYLCAEYSKIFNQYFVRILYFAEDLYKWDRFAFPDGKGKSGFYWSDSEWGCGLADGVTHWMPLPEPPTKEGADNG